MIQPAIVGAIVRQLLTFIGTWLMARGSVGAGDWQSITEAAVGLATVLASATWSIKQKRKTNGNGNAG